METTKLKNIKKISEAKNWFFDKKKFPDSQSLATLTNSKRKRGPN